MLISSSGDMCSTNVSRLRGWTGGDTARINGVVTAMLTGTVTTSYESRLLCYYQEQWTF